MGQMASEILEDVEQRWAPHLRSASLVAELQVEESEVSLAARCLGRVYRAREHEVRARGWRLRHYPASMLLALSGIAALSYQEGTYWSTVWEMAEIAGYAHMQQEWGTPTFSH